MLRVKVSVTFQSIGMEMRRAIQYAMEIGAQGIQFDLRNELRPGEYGETARRQLLHLLSEHGLQISSAHFPLRGALTARERMEERLAALADAIDFASKLKIRKLTLRAGRVPSEEKQQEFELLQSVLSELAGRGNQRGVVLCLIPCGESAGDLQRLIASIKTGPVMVDADLAAWVLNRQSVVSQLRELHDLIGQFEIRDAIRDVDGTGREVPVGRGEIDWDEVAALMGEMDFAGWLNVDRTAGPDRRGDIARAVQYLGNLIPREAR